MQRRQFELTVKCEAKMVAIGYENRGAMKESATVTIVGIAGGAERVFGFQRRSDGGGATGGDLKGNMVWGNVSFVQMEGKVIVRADVRGLAAKRAVRVSRARKGRLQFARWHSGRRTFQPDRKAARALQRGRTTRGRFDEPEVRCRRHGRVRIRNEFLSVTAGPTSVVGRAIIIHAEPDDYRTQPAGNSGARDRLRS